MRRFQETLFLTVALAAFASGCALYGLGAAGAGRGAFALTTTLGILPAAWWVIDSARNRRLGVDVVALLALIGTLAVREYFAGAVVTVMLASGRALEARASARARRELRALLERAPRTVHRYDGQTLTTPTLEEVGPGDLLMVQPGEVVPVDGLLERDVALLDESALTGEPLPVERAVGDAVRSGVVNAGSAFDLRATTSAQDSTYAGIVRLVTEAEASTAPFIRLADRFAGAFLFASLALAGAAWLLSGDVVRAIAVLVVATPCPLILAAPVAVVSGLSLAARRGVVVKGGAALEQLARGEILLFDKTGTITAGRPTLSDIVPAGTMSSDDVLRLAASLDQVSPHVLASAVVRAARARSLALSLPHEVEEIAGHGIRGVVDGRHVAVGKARWASPTLAASWLRSARRRAELDSLLTVFVQVDGVTEGVLLFADPIRSDAARTMRRLRGDGIRRIVMVTGDRQAAAEAVGAVVGVDEVLADRTPSEKVDAVRLERRSGPTIMVGDGINDAPALALADVGVAIGTRGSTASSEAADVVLTVDRLDRVGEAIVIAKRSRKIAWESVLAGVGLSLVAMVFAALGYLPPAAGAVIQEIIDVAVIVNALRALRDVGGGTHLEGSDALVANRFRAEHGQLRPNLARLRTLADNLDLAHAQESLAMAREVERFLVEDLGPHEKAEDEVLYPVLARVLGGRDPMGTMSRAHVEIAHMIRRISRLLDDLDPETADEYDIAELRHLLYGLHAILQLHFAQEDEGYLSLVDDDPTPPTEGDDPGPPSSYADRNGERRAAHGRASTDDGSERIAIAHPDAGHSAIEPSARA